MVLIVYRNKFSIYFPYFPLCFGEKMSFLVDVEVVFFYSICICIYAIILGHSDDDLMGGGTFQTVFRRLLLMIV